LRVARLVVLSLGVADAARAVEGTTVFEDPVAIEAAGAPIDFPSHAIPRVVDWDADSDADLLVGVGDGSVWLFLDTGSAFAAGVRVAAGGSPIQVSVGTTGTCFTDLSDDGLPDLVVAHGGDGVRLYANTGTLAQPAFAAFQDLQGSVSGGGSTPSFLPPFTDGRIDCADWDSDGLVDLLTGEFDGSLKLFRNDGTSTAAHFALAEALTFHGSAIVHPYYTLPRAVDLNQDGLLDLARGINWGDVLIFPNDGTGQAPHLSAQVYVTDDRATILDLRPWIDWETTPDFTDLDGDGLLDLVTGGQNGKVFALYGVPYQDRIARIEDLMAAHGSDLGDDLASDPDLRQELFGLHRTLRNHAGLFLIDDAAKEPIADWYDAHIAAYPQYLPRQYLDPAVDTYVPFLAGQVWVNLLEAGPDTLAHRIVVADAAGFSGRYRDILLGFGTLFVENSTASAAQQEVVYDELAGLPGFLPHSELITIQDFMLGAPIAVPPEIAIQARTGVNIFSIEVGAYCENQFPSDVSPGTDDIYASALAHELNHVVDSRYVQDLEQHPELAARRSELLSQAGSVDLEYLHVPVGSLDAAFFQAYPQEFVASIANQWLASSAHTFTLARVRMDAGYEEPMNQALFFAEIYSGSAATTTFYTIDCQGQVTVSSVPVKRDGNAHINALYYGGNALHVALDSSGNALSYTFGPATTCDDGIDNDGDGKIDYPADPQCSSPADPTERKKKCGLLGVEPLAALALVRAWRRTRTRWTRWQAVGKPFAGSRK
jgi:hypothetical protein